MIRTSVMSDLMDSAQAEFPERKVPLADIFSSYMKIALSSVGGGLSGWVQQEVVENRRWLTSDEFLSGLAMCQILPGPNQIILSVFIGTRLRGALGALTALAGLMVLPFFIAIGLSALYLRFEHVEEVQKVIRGMSAAAAGMTVAMGFRLLRRYLGNWSALSIMAATFVASGLLHYRLLYILAVLTPLSILLQHYRQKSVKRKEHA